MVYRIIVISIVCVRTCKFNSGYRQMMMEEREDEGTCRYIVAAYSTYIIMARHDLLSIDGHKASTLSKEGRES